MDIVSLLITIIVFAIVFGLVWWLLQQLPLPPAALQIVRVCVIVLAIVLLLGVLFGGVQMPSWQIRR